MGTYPLGKLEITILHYQFLCTICTHLYMLVYLLHVHVYVYVLTQDKDIRIIMGYFYEDKAIATLCQVLE